MIERAMVVVPRRRHRWLPRLAALLTVLAIGVAVREWRAETAPVPADVAQRVVDQVQRSSGYRSDLASAQLLTGMPCQLGPQPTACYAALFGLLAQWPGVRGAQHPVPAAGLHRAITFAVVPGPTTVYNPRLQWRVAATSIGIVTTMGGVLAPDAHISRHVERESGGYRLIVRQEWGQTPCAYGGPGAALVCKLLTHPYYWQLVYHARGTRISKGAFSSNALPH